MGYKKQENRMYALWCHPEAVQWWFDKLVAGHNGSWSSKMQSAIAIILNDPIRIRATKDSLGLFPNQMWRIRSAPECVREWHRDMYSAKFFLSATSRPEFLDIHFSKCVLDIAAEHTFDRVGSVAWVCYWILHGYPNHHFLARDICLVALQQHLGCTVQRTGLPEPPFECKSEISTIRSIYDCISGRIEYDT